jgi:hypothetical protein
MTAFDLAKEWLRYAQSDLNTANHMFNDVYPKETEICCYHAQQCAEKVFAFCNALLDIPSSLPDSIDESEPNNSQRV